MNICFYSLYNIFNYNNAAFDPKSFPIGDDLGRTGIELKELLEKKGHFVGTFDQKWIYDFDVFVFSDFPTNNVELLKSLYDKKKKLVLWTVESEIIHPANIKKENLIYFDKIITYNPNLINTEEKAVFNMVCEPFYEDVKFYSKTFYEKKFATMICGNKYSNFEGELYSTRYKILRWFTKKHPLDFDLYGTGWKNKLEPICNIPKVRRIVKKVFKINNKCYRGTVEEKNRTMSNYKFAFCLENARRCNYISEKIFDGFFSGCVPIYYGAPNVTDYIPSDCFIDFGQFSSIKSLYLYLKNMSEQKYNEYLNNIQTFLRSDKYKRFNVYNVATVLENL